MTMYTSALGLNTTGTKLVTIPAPPSTNQMTVIDFISVVAFSATAAGVGTILVSIPTSIQGAAGQALRAVTPTVSAAGASTSWQMTFPGPGFIARDTANSAVVSADSVPNSMFASMDIVVGFHYA